MSFTHKNGAGTSPDTGDFPYPVMSPSTFPSAYGDAIDQSDIQEISDDWLKQQEGSGDDNSSLPSKVNRHQQIVTSVKESMSIRITDTGLLAWGNIHSPELMTSGSRKDLESAIQFMVEGHPLSDRQAKLAAGDLAEAARKMVRRGEVPEVVMANRYYTSGGIGGDSFISHAYHDSDERGSITQITGDGNIRFGASTPDNVVFSASEKIGEMEVNEKGTVDDLMNGMMSLNITRSQIPLLLGALLTPVVDSYADRPVVLISGPAGSGKTTVATRLLEIIHPGQGGITAESMTSTTGDRDAFERSLIGAEAEAIGNIQRITPAISDALCMVGSGAIHRQKELYRNSSYLAHPLRCLIFLSTVAEDITLRSDLQSRILPIKTRRIPDTPERHTENIRMTQEWRANLPRIRMGLFRLAAEVKKRYNDNPRREVPNLYRWSGTSMIMTILSEILMESGHSGMDWSTSYKKSSEEMAYEGAPPIVRWLIEDYNEEIVGSAGQLLSEFRRVAKEENTDTCSGWVESAKGMSTVLKQYHPLLSKFYTITREKDDSYRPRLIRMVPKKRKR